MRGQIAELLAVGQLNADGLSGEAPLSSLISNKWRIADYSIDRPKILAAIGRGFKSEEVLAMECGSHRILSQELNSFPYRRLMDIYAY